MIKNGNDKISWIQNGKNSRVGSVRKWIDGNYYHKQLTGWVRLSSSEEISFKKYKDRFFSWDSKKHREYIRSLENNVDLCMLLPEHIIYYLKELHEMFAIEKE